MDINLELARDNVSSSRGAPMGRPALVYCLSPTVHIQRVQMVDGDYDAGGAYWGGYPAKPLYCAMTKAGDDFRVFRRADSRADAVRQLRAEYPDIRFYRD